MIPRKSDPCSLPSFEPQKKLFSVLKESFGFCPLGAMYGLFNPVSIFRFKLEADKCISCGQCRRACPMDIKVYEHPNSMECIRCGACIEACPTRAVRASFIRTGACKKENGGAVRGS